MSTAKHHPDPHDHTNPTGHIGHTVVLPRRHRLARRRSVVVALVAMLVMLIAPPAVSAHEFGPFAIDRYAAIRVAPDEIEIDYVLSLAETPTQAEGDTIEADSMAYCATLLGNVEILLDGSAVEFADVAATTMRQEGDGGLTTLRVVCSSVTSIDVADGARAMTIVDDNFSRRVGWREIIVIGDRTSVSGEVDDESITDRLTDYPEPSENLETRTAAFEFTADETVDATTLPTTEPGNDDGDDDGGGDAFSNLIASADGGLGAMLIALGFAAFLGALHSLAPGHGKTVIGAYLVGTKGTKVQALVLAIAVALSHTLGVLILGIITYAAGAAFAPERVYPWLQGLSAVIVFGIGVWLVWTAWKEWRGRTRTQTRTAKSMTPALAGARGHDHHSDHVHDSGHDHDHGSGHDHDHDHGHDHDHDHGRDHGSGHDHDHDHDHDLDHDHDHGHDHDHDRDGWHRHGIFPHTHRFDLDDMDLAGKVSWKTLAMLGLSGGLVPSTSAIIVLLGAIQLNRIAFGGLLIMAFGVGMAIALVSVGLGMVALRDKAFGAMDGNSIIRTARIWVVPIAAIAVLCIGIFLLIRAGLEISDL